MDPFRSRDELRAFVASLDLPEDRREIIALELLDHVELRERLALLHKPQEEAEQIALASLGTPGDLRQRFEHVSRLFSFDLRAALRLGARMSAAYLLGLLAAYQIASRGIGGFHDWAFFRDDWAGALMAHTPWPLWWIAFYAIQLLVVLLALKWAWPPAIFTRLRRDLRSLPTLSFLGMVTVSAAIPVEVASWSPNDGIALHELLFCATLWLAVTLFWIGGTFIDPKTWHREPHEVE